MSLESAHLLTQLVSYLCDGHKARVSADPIEFGCGHAYVAGVCLALSRELNKFEFDWEGENVKAQNSARRGSGECCGHVLGMHTWWCGSVL